ncbi:cupin domain-containing protein [Neomoorella glycerini]|uniref:cupin domain-containing protein n=1 Tax=Neomoorella glycerini TaxID=55779 RepID=UPI001FE5F209
MTMIECGIFECQPGSSLARHVHENGDEYCYLFAGQGIFEIGGQEYEVEAGQTIKIPRGVEHRSFNNGEHTFRSFYVVCP